MTAQNKQILSAIKNAVTGVLPDGQVILFGSRARNDYREDSDWDILILTNKKVSSSLKKQITDELFPIGLNFETCISKIVLNREDWENKFKQHPLHLEVNKEGIVL